MNRTNKVLIPSIKFCFFHMNTECLGTSSFRKLDKKTCTSIVDSFLQTGNHMIDTADVYGDAEVILSDYPQATIATKFSCKHSRGNDKQCLFESVESSLRRLKRDAIDLLWVHIWDRNTTAESLMDNLQRIIEQGKVKQIGICNSPSWFIAHANHVAQTPFKYIQQEYSLLNRCAEIELIPMSERFGIKNFGWGCLGKGFLSGKNKQSRWDDKRTKRVYEEVKNQSELLKVSTSQVGLNWVRSKGVTPIIGASNVKQLKENLMRLEFDTSSLDEVSDIGNYDLLKPGSEFSRYLDSTLSQHPNT